MATFAQIGLEPGGLIAWVAVGLLAGSLAARFMRGSGCGLARGLVVGLVGALAGGFLFGMMVPGEDGLVGSILVAFLGACLLIGVARQVAPVRSSA